MNRPDKEEEEEEKKKERETDRPTEKKKKKRFNQKKKKEREMDKPIEKKKKKRKEEEEAVASRRHPCFVIVFFLFSFFSVFFPYKRCIGPVSIYQPKQPNFAGMAGIFSGMK